MGPTQALPIPNGPSRSLAHVVSAICLDREVLMGGQEPRCNTSVFHFESLPKLCTEQVLNKSLITLLMIRKGLQIR